MAARFLPAVVAGWLAIAVASIGHAQDAELPNTPGKAQFVQVCSQCHMPGVVAAQRRDAREWADVMARMIDFGAVGTDAELKAVAAYLSANFGTGAPTPSAAPSRPLEDKLHAR